MKASYEENRKKLAEKVVEKIARENPDATIESIIKQALKNL